MVKKSKFLKEYNVFSYMLKNISGEEDNSQTEKLM